MAGGDVVLWADPAAGVCPYAVRVQRNVVHALMSEPRDLAIGLAIMLGTAGPGLAVDWTGVLDAVVGILILLFTASLGIPVRYWSSNRLRGHRA